MTHVKKIVITNVPSMGAKLLLHGVCFRELSPGDTTIVIADIFREIWRKEQIFWSTPSELRDAIPASDRTTHSEILALAMNNIRVVSSGTPYHQCNPPDTLQITEPPEIVLNATPKVVCTLVT